MEPVDMSVGGAGLTVSPPASPVRSVHASSVPTSPVAAAASSTSSSPRAAAAAVVSSPPSSPVRSAGGVSPTHAAAADDAEHASFPPPPPQSSSYDHDQDLQDEDIDAALESLEISSPPRSPSKASQFGQDGGMNEEGHLGGNADDQDDLDTLAAEADDILGEDGDKW